MASAYRDLSVKAEIKSKNFFMNTLTDDFANVS